MRPIHGRLCWITILWLCSGANSAWASSLTGRVVNVQNGQGLASAAVILERGEESSGASIVTVFTDSSGQYTFPPADLAGELRNATLRVRILGYHQVYPSKEAVPLKAAGKDGVIKGVDFTLEPAASVADIAPASAWLRSIPQSGEKEETILQCVGCHQFPSLKARHFAEQIEQVHNSSSEAATSHAWHDQVRKEAWRAAVKYMRARSYDIFPEGTAIQLEKIKWDTVQSPEYSLFNEKDEEIISEFLSKNLPRNFQSLTEYQYGAPLAVTGRTVMREYRLPPTANVREVTPLRNSHYYFGADIEQNRLLRLDPTTGERVWIDVPSEVATGPHTVISDRDGNIWVSLIESDRLGRYDTRTQKWTLWSLRPSSLQAKQVFGGQAIVHDIAFDANYELALDAKGNVWLSLIGLNKIASLNPKSGEVRYFDANPPIKGRNAFNTSLYGALLSPDGKCVWYSQLSSGVTCFNTQTLKNESHIEFPEGSGPRRMAMDEGHTLWIPLFGAGQIVKYDTNERKPIATYDLPDRAAAPYAVTWDPKRHVLWVGTSNADVIYRFDPKSEKFSVIPFVRQMGYLRRIALDYATGDLITTYANIPTGSGPSMVVTVHLPE
jgi:streptogramin lyase